MRVQSWTACATPLDGVSCASSTCTGSIASTTRTRMLVGGLLPARIREDTLNWYAFVAEIEPSEKLDNLRRAIEEMR